jgi:replicative DNA helicase
MKLCYSLEIVKKTIDVVTLSDQLIKNGTLEIIWGTDYLYDISLYLITPSVCGEYGKIIKEKSVLRSILKVSQTIIGDVYSEKDTPTIIEAIEKQIFSLVQYNQGDSLKHISELLGTRVEELMYMADHPEEMESNKTLSGYNSLDKITGGFKAGEIIILAARPSMGKTAFSLNLLLNAALGQKKSIAFFSLEMSSQSIVDRLLSTETGIPMTNITKGLLSDDDYASIGESIAKLSEYDIYIDEESNTLPVIKSKLRKIVIEKGKVDMVIIDYMQLINTVGMKYAGNRVQEVSEISRTLKEMAKELKCPIIALSQLSRENEKRPDKQPILSDLRDSGSIEQDADLVVFCIEMNTMIQTQIRKVSLMSWWEKIEMAK